jgi:hypothetical protein
MSKTADLRRKPLPQSAARVPLQADKIAVDVLTVQVEVDNMAIKRLMLAPHGDAAKNKVRWLNGN